MGCRHNVGIRLAAEELPGRVATYDRVPVP
jgi:hypothetical protein